MINNKGKIGKTKTINNKNYGNIKKKKKKRYDKSKKDVNNNIDERFELQKRIDETLCLLVEENKRKQYEEKINNDLEKNENGKNILKSDKTNNNTYDEDELKNNKNKKYKNNLTIIDKNVLTSTEFKTLPISKRTLRSLNENNFIYMTNIQYVSLPIVLLNKHIYAQAQTGTGKTLCFCIPLIEKMYRNSIDNYNKILGGIIITPTRELVFQIFEVLNMLNKYHKLNICCAIGGKNEEKEKSIFSYANIIVCTTGRLLYHLENNYYCNLDYLSTLIIDEIDKLIDKSFYDNLKNILLYKPKENCQICLFSATICKFLNVILNTFHIKDYEYVSINDNDKYIESNNVKQIYIECDIYEKINYLYTFLFSKKNKKVIVFFSTCKQVRFMYEVFKKIKVGVMKFLQLHGKLKQTSRLNTYHFFSKKKNFVCLFTTDIACRGLDFSSIDWVIHFDFPDNIETFIHRSGRTGRFTNMGNSLIFLTKQIDNKKLFLNVLKDNNIFIKEKFIKKQKLFDIKNKIHSLNAAFVDIKHLAKKALIIYLRHLYIVMKFKDIKKKIDLNELAYAYGLIEFSEDMINDLNINDEKDIQVKKKKSRLEKFLEILKNKKAQKKKQNQEKKDEEKDNNIQDEKEYEYEYEYENEQGHQIYDEEHDNYMCEKKKKVLKDISHIDQNDEDDLFIQKRVEIKDDTPIMLPTKKRKKRVKVAKTLSNSILYDDSGNEIKDDNVKFKILVNELNQNEDHDMEEDTHYYNDDNDNNNNNNNSDSNRYDQRTYIESLKEKIQRDNEKIKISKLRKKEDFISDRKKHEEDLSSTENIDPSDNEDKDDYEYKESSESDNENYNTSEDFDKNKRNISEKCDPTDDISDLENKVMMFL
ncbi:DEAD/DEAH box ATP-dependent RNA helicase, putative [Plasmodium sp. gorilla clade G2]|uniref:DEAD/DEAH box ATP-dependent RNA helicase, putative n=1 Tax=Plasmodium sp. gorilla clade G2 TaxID=880535 RepID=UPI000D22AA40|nr:DEAD/DEAH box ATP-dependent RNA helicase, putative [Plasmodium sp. gorilla clade G2]SOV18894.1 DEAD/DEAH box ATP-dependent RNA helicase, putative [Plasmodium sp. gorilla clade G2]